jgi:hypothetical protein
MLEVRGHFFHLHFTGIHCYFKQDLHNDCNCFEITPDFFQLLLKGLEYMLNLCLRITFKSDQDEDGFE